MAEDPFTIAQTLPMFSRSWHPEAMSRRDHEDLYSQAAEIVDAAGMKGVVEAAFITASPVDRRWPDPAVSELVSNLLEAVGAAHRGETDPNVWRRLSKTLVRTLIDPDSAQEPPPVPGLGPTPHYGAWS